MFEGLSLRPAGYSVIIVILPALNGFGKGRSTVDHILTLDSTTETKKLKRQSTFTALFDFKKAYDATDRTLLFTKLNHYENTPIQIY